MDSPEGPNENPRGGNVGQLFNYGSQYNPERRGCNRISRPKGRPVGSCEVPTGDADRRIGHTRSDTRPKMKRRGAEPRGVDDPEQSVLATVGKCA
jgi:hypothetical protein